MYRTRQEDVETDDVPTTDATQMQTALKKRDEVVERTHPFKRGNPLPVVAFSVHALAYH